MRSMRGFRYLKYFWCSGSERKSIVFVLALSLALWVSPQVSAQAEMDATPQAFDLVQEKARLLKLLKEEIEPNLVAADVQKLKKNVMRLGSFRAEWVQEAKDFLVANSPLAELYLYDYSRIHNPRLNSRILETLLQFSSYKYEAAALAFAEDLSINENSKSIVLELLEKVLSKANSVELRTASLGLVFGEWGLQLRASEKLQMALKLCQSGAAFSLQDRGRLEEYSKRQADFWSTVMFEELRACYSGA